MLLRCTAAVAAALVSGSTHASEVVRHPTSKWLVEFADNECLLSRSYGNDRKQLILTFEQSPMEKGIAIYVLKTGNKSEMNNGLAQVSFRNGFSEDVTFGAYLIAKKALRRILIVVQNESFKAAAASERLTISVPGEVRETFAIPGFGAALKVMDQCVVDLGKHWGISAEDQLRLAEPARPLKPLGKYFSANDYPLKALKDHATGRTNVRIAVDQSGRPTDCVVMKASGNDTLDRETCRILLQRARFEPATDVGGKPMKSVIVTAVTWILG